MNIQNCSDAYDIMSNSQMFDSWYPNRTQEACKWNVISASLQHSCVRANWKTPNHAGPQSLTPLLAAPCQSPFPPFSSLSFSSLVFAFQQRAIWVRLPGSSGGPLHRKRLLLLNICLPRSKMFLFTLFNSSSFFPPLPVFFPSIPSCLSLPNVCQNFPHIKQEVD